MAPAGVATTTEPLSQPITAGAEARHRLAFLLAPFLDAGIAERPLDSAEETLGDRLDPAADGRRKFDGLSSPLGLPLPRPKSLKAPPLTTANAARVTTGSVGPLVSRRGSPRTAPRYPPPTSRAS